MTETDFFDPKDAPRDGTLVFFYLPDPNRPDSEDQVIAAFDTRREVWCDQGDNVVDVSTANSASIFGNAE